LYLPVDTECLVDTGINKKHPEEIKNSAPVQKSFMSKEAFQYVPFPVGAVTGSCKGLKNL